jgi:hypothetical protein
MDEKDTQEPEADDLEAQEGEELPDRDMMSWVTPGPLEGDLFPPDIDPAEES